MNAELIFKELKLSIYNKHGDEFDVLYNDNQESDFINVKFE